MELVQKYMPEIKRLMRFGIVGVGATLVHVGTSLFFLSYLTESAHLSNAAGFSVAFFFSFTGQYLWTFKSTKHPLVAMTKFFMVALTGFLGSALLLGYLTEHSELTKEISLVVSIFIIPVITYITGKYLIF